jgi:phenylalanyl-tRNA synthetase beta chain
MKFTLSWLRQHLATDATLATLTDTLSAIGLEVEGVEDRGAALAPFRIAEVLTAVPHPNADRLRACQVSAGGETISVVCGAPNARAGMKAVFAPPGSFIPGSGITLKTGEIRGVTSAGMLLSLREMGLGEDHDGIVELPADAPVGASYASWAGLDDPVIEIAVTPNRGDALSVRGIARDLAAAGLGALKPWAAPEVAGHFTSPLGWAIEWPEACPWVLGRMIRGLRNGPSPRWLAERLRSVGLRPINTLVDITNVFTLDLGRPLHVFDAGKLTGATLTLRAGRDETLRALDGRDYVATAADCVIADGAGVQSLAGVIGGAASGCDEATSSVFLECALFDPVRVGQTGRRLQIASDARQRFERGIDAALMRPALDAATRMILDLCGGEASAVAEAGAAPAWRREASLRFARLESFGGVADLAPDTAVGYLEKLGFVPLARDAARVRVAVPSWRNDIAAAGPLDLAPALQAQRVTLTEAAQAMEAEADLIEEILRLHRLDRVPPVSLPPLAAVPPPSLTPRQSRTALARRALAARGLVEAVSFSFTDRQSAALFAEPPAALALLNPIATDLGQMRPTPLGSLAQAARRNAARGMEAIALFEIGPAFTDPTPQGQNLVAAGLRCGAPARHWIGTRPLDAIAAKADALAVLIALGVPEESLSATRDAPGFYHPGRSGVLRQGPKLVLAQFGELHPSLLAAFDLPAPAVGFEVFLDRIAEPKRRRRTLALAALQPVRRDFAFLADADTSAEAVLRAARGADRTLIAEVALFDVYAGEGIAEGERSLGVEVVLQPRERALTDAEIEAVCARVIGAVVKATGARLRG